MNLHEAIEAVLRENNHPMKAQDIASAINLNKYYSRNDKKPLVASHVYAHIKNYPSIFQNINGWMVLVYDNTWKNLLTSYEYLTQTLKGIFIQADVQFIIAVLLYYKRILDKGQNFPIDKEILRSTINGGDSLIRGFWLLESSKIAPRGVFEECSRMLAKVDSNKLQEIESILRRIETEDLSDRDFGNYAEYLLTSVAFDSIKSSLNNTPYSLRQLMVEILDTKKGNSVYDPVAGIGGLLIDALFYADGRIHAYGSEINQRIAQLGNMNMWMQGFRTDHIEAEDCFGGINSNNTYDCVIADLPANGITNSAEHYRLYKQYKLSAPKSGKSFGSLVLFALSKLKPNGKAVLTVSDGFLAKKGKEQEIRNLLIKHDVIESIISLPHGTLRPYTDSKASLLVLNKNKPAHLARHIQFITGSIADQTANG